MAGTNNTSQWEAPKFSFSAVNQAEEERPSMLEPSTNLKHCALL